MYYFALRNYGYDLITRQGNLEGGIYQLTLAERFGMLDRDSNGLREGARYYLIGASFWELDWQQALFYFDQVYRGWAGLWDGTMTASERFHFASMRYGDQLVAEGQYCDAVAQYQNAQAIAPLDGQAGDGFEEAYIACFPATETITPTLAGHSHTWRTNNSANRYPAWERLPTDTPAPPTETPTETPSLTPTP